MSDTEPTIQLTASVVLFAAKMHLGQKKNVAEPMQSAWWTASWAGLYLVNYSFNRGMVFEMKL